MSNKPNMRYNWNESADWDEFTWEKLMRESDEYAAHYFEMLEKFGDLPDSDEFIQSRLKDLPCPQYEESLYFEQLEIENTELLSDIPAEDGIEQEDYDIGPDQPLFHEQQKCYILLRHTALGWCNVQATYLLTEHQPLGVEILHLLGRSIAHLVASLGDGLYFDTLGANIASTKRSLAQINEALGKIEELKSKNESYQQVCHSISTLLYEVHDLIVQQLLLLRSHPLTSS